MSDKVVSRPHRIGDERPVSTPAPPERGALSVLNREQAALHLGVTVRSVTGFAQEGKLQPIQHKKRTYYTLESVEKLKTSRERRAPELDEASAKRAVAELDRQNRLQLLELEERLKALEQIAGVAGRGVGLNRPMLYAIVEEVVRKNLQVPGMDADEKEIWMRRIAALDYRTIKYCFSDGGLAKLPIWLLRLGVKIANSRGTAKERNEDLLHCRNLRLLLQSFAPPKPIYYCDFEIPTGLSVIDALILSSCAA